MLVLLCATRFCSFSSLVVLSLSTPKIGIHFVTVTTFKSVYSLKQTTNPNDYMPILIQTVDVP